MRYSRAPGFPCTNSVILLLLVSLYDSLQRRVTLFPQRIPQYASRALLLIFGLFVLSASKPIGVLGRALDCCVISSRVMLKSEAVLVGTLPASFLGRLRTSSAGFHHDRYGVSLLCETSTSVYGLYLRLNIIFSEAEGKLILVSSAVF